MDRKEENYTTIAAADGIGHMVPAKGRSSQTACGLPATDERLAWPARAICWTCAALTASPTRGTRR
jgi:hypothetical protein